MSVSFPVQGIPSFMGTRPYLPIPTCAEVFQGLPHNWCSSLPCCLAQTWVAAVSVAPLAPKEPLFPINTIRLDCPESHWWISLAARKTQIKCRDVLNRYWSLFVLQTGASGQSQVPPQNQSETLQNQVQSAMKSVEKRLVFIRCGSEGSEEAC